MRTGATYILLCAAACGCSSSHPGLPADAGLDGPDDMDGQAGDAGGDGGVLGPDWSCVDTLEVPAPDAESADVIVVVTNYLIHAGMADVEVSACSADDPECASPIDAMTTSEEGTASLTLPLGDQGFDGFYRAEKADYLPALLYGSLPLVKATTDPLPIFEMQLLPSGAVVLFGAALGVDIDLETMGVIGAGVSDCEREFASGLHFELSPEPGDTTLRYIEGGGPSRDATETDESGQGVFVNVPPGAYTLIARRVDNGEAVSAVEVQSRAGVLTEAHLEPTPNGVAFDPDP